MTTVNLNLVFNNKFQIKQNLTYFDSTELKANYIFLYKKNRTNRVENKFAIQEDVT